jgi:ferrochelatase
MMSPLELQHTYSSDDRLFTGRFFPLQALDVGPGARVGVVLLVPGAPESKADVLPYLYRRLLRPVKARGLRRFWQTHVAATIRARWAAGRLQAEYDAIGGGSVINRLNREQAQTLAKQLAASAAGGRLDGVQTSVYTASPFGVPDMVDTARKMDEDGVTHVVLLPLFPQYAMETTGRALAEWESLMASGAFTARPTVAIREFATHDLFIRAMSERMDQALQRFPKHARENVQILFAAHGAADPVTGGMQDPYCCQAHYTADAVMKHRGNDIPFSLAFVRPNSWGSRLSWSVPERFRDMVANGRRSVLVVPVDHVSEQFDTTFVLDVRMRDAAEAEGISHYHVSSGLNCHPLFVDALTDLVHAALGRRDARLPQMEMFSSCPRPLWNADASSREDVTCAVCPLSATSRRPHPHLKSTPADVRASRQSGLRPAEWPHVE